MNLHENYELFADTINFASRPKSDGGLGIAEIFIEKDYWITRSLKLMATSDPEQRAVFKGGTSLSKAYNIGARFSEDIDIAIADAWNLSGNQLKNVIRRTAHKMTVGLDEVNVPGQTSKGSHYHKAFYRYPQKTQIVGSTAIRSGQILLEINSFANPYPYEHREIESFITTFLRHSGNEELIKEYDMDAFTIPVLDKRRTLTEKLVSLIRCSLSNDFQSQLQAKIRHFYDLHFLLNDVEIAEYLKSKRFTEDFNTLLSHDREQFSKPEGWQSRQLSQSPLLSSLDSIWSKLESTYVRELSSLAYSDIPSPNEIFASIQQVLEYIKL